MYGYLAHHGIKGQKWGVRRYQYEDGSLTAEGRTRYGLENTKLISGTTGSSATALAKHVKQIRKDIKADYKEDKKYAKQNYSGKERKAKVREVNEMYNRSIKSINEALKMKYGEDAMKRYATRQTAKRTLPLVATLLVSDLLMSQGAYMILDGTNTNKENS